MSKIKKPDQDKISMPFSMPDIPREKVIALVMLAVLFAFVGVGAKMFENRPAAPVLQIDPNMLTLKGRGSLPDFHVALSGSTHLVNLVDALKVVPAEDIFTKKTEIDMRIVDILLIWADANLAHGGDYGPYVDARVVSFLKRVGVVPDSLAQGTEIDLDRATKLNDIWFEVFDYYRLRLLIQTAGKGVYEGQSLYDIAGDKIVVRGVISKPFIDRFQGQLKIVKNPAEVMRNFLDFVDGTKGFSRLSDQEQDWIMSLDAGRAPSTVDAAAVPAAAGSAVAAPVH